MAAAVMRHLRSESGRHGIGERTAAVLVWWGPESRPTTRAPASRRPLTISSAGSLDVEGCRHTHPWIIAGAIQKTKHARTPRTERSECICTSGHYAAGRSEVHLGFVQECGDNVAVFHCQVARPTPAPPRRRYSIPCSSRNSAARRAENCDEHADRGAQSGRYSRAPANTTP